MSLDKTNNTQNPEVDSQAVLKNLISETVQESVKAVIESEQAKQNAEQIKSLEDKIETLTKAQEEMKSAKARKFSVDGERGQVQLNDTQTEVKSIHLDALISMRKNPNTPVQIKSLGQRAEEKQKFFLGGRQSEIKMYNSFSGVDGGYGARPSEFMGTVNINQMAYAPILALAREVTANLNGNQYLTFDPSKLKLHNNKEAVAAKQGGKISLGEVLITTEEVSEWVPVSNRMIDMNSDGDLRYDPIAQHQQWLNRVLEQKVSNQAMDYIKDEAKNNKLATHTTATNGKITIDDIMGILVDGLKDEYLSNAVLFVNRSVLRTLAQEKGSNGQYIWRNILSTNESAISRINPRFNSPVGGLTIVGISEKASNKFDDVASGNTVGILADWNEFLHVAFNGGFRVMDLERHTQVEGYHRLYERAYAGLGIVNREAGVSIKIK